MWIFSTFGIYRLLVYLLFLWRKLNNCNNLSYFHRCFKNYQFDLMKPTFNDLLNAPDTNPMTTTHMNYMMNPIIMVFDKIFDKLFPWLDKYDFDAAKLNSKIGFWGSKFAIGIYLGIFVGLLAGQTPTQIFSILYGCSLFGTILFNWNLVYRCS